MKTIDRKAMLYKSKVEYMSGEGVYAMNHVLGCSHGCKYPCYAYLAAKRVGQVESYEQWREPKPVENALELLERELEDHLRCLDASGERPTFLERVEIERGGRALGSELMHDGSERDAYRAVQDIAFSTPGPCVFCLDPDGDGWSLSARAEHWEEARSALASMQPRIRTALRPLGLRARFGGLKEPVRRVHLCFTTDPFPYPMSVPGNYGNHQDMLRISNMSMDAIRLLNSKDIPVTILTKGLLPVSHYSSDSMGNRYECLRSICGSDDEVTKIPITDLHPNNEYGISLVSLNERFRVRWEPGAAPYAERIASLRALHDAGCRTWVSMEPWMEPSCYGHEDLDELYDCLAAVIFVDRIVFGKRNHSGNPSIPLSRIYYSECARIVREFCAATGIECVIKEGTDIAGNARIANLGEEGEGVEAGSRSLEAELEPEPKRELARLLEEASGWRTAELADPPAPWDYAAWLEARGIGRDGSRA